MNIEQFERQEARRQRREERQKHIDAEARHFQRQRNAARAAAQWDVEAAKIVRREQRRNAGAPLDL